MLLVRMSWADVLSVMLARGVMCDMKKKMSEIGDNTQNLGDIPKPHMAEHIAGNEATARRSY